jgi:hypothetical protein
MIFVTYYLTALFLRSEYSSTGDKQTGDLSGTETVLHRGDVIRDFLDIIDGNAGRCLVFK